MKRIIVITMAVALLIIGATTHTQVAAQQRPSNIIGFCKCLKNADNVLFEEWFGNIGHCAGTFRRDSVTWMDFTCNDCTPTGSAPCYDCILENDIKVICVLPSPYFSDD